MLAFNSTPGSCLQARSVLRAAKVRRLSGVFLPISQLRKPRFPKESGFSRLLRRRRQDRRQSPHLLQFLNNLNLINPDHSPNKEKFIQVVTSLNLKLVQQLECPSP